MLENRTVKFLYFCFLRFILLRLFYLHVRSVPSPTTVEPQAASPQEADPRPKEIETVVVTPAVKPASVSDVTPTRKIVPKK